ncbi:MAG: serine/threonine-protein kinase [Planctomycetota bacterium]|nr:serine/threonine-protein kinase [Planctomycetota bacterium]
MDDRVNEIMNRLRKESPTDPKAFAEAACEGDAELLDRVLDALGTNDGTIEVPDARPPVAPAEEATVEVRRTGSRSSADSGEIPESGGRTGSPTSRLRRPDRIGHFQIESQVPIGRGGFGEVWEAFRVEGGFRQRVAVKIISRAVPDEKVVRRFELERQVLASLDHPAIARLIDGGEMDDGRPWLAMEFVDGVAVTKYCDRERLSIDERVRLFLKIAMAVQHAHENLVVHRDIKPDNVLVTDKGDPKLLDFGIAKLVNPDLGGDGARVTQAGEGVLTPDYAAPEQFTGQGIGTRADVYSLGVLLYELLTGRLPFQDEDRSGYVNIRTAKLEKEPPRPSDAVSTASIDQEAAERISRARDTGLERIKRRLDGDLDVIILKALRREPSRRYASPRDLVADLQRHLDGLPVEARPDSIGYRTTRFVARHRAGVAVTALAIVAVALTASTLAAFSEAKASRAEANLAAANAEAEAARAESAETIRQAFAGIELLSAARGTESLVSSLVESNRLDDAERIAKAMSARLDTALEIAPDEPDLLARKLVLDLERARLRAQRRNPSLGDVEDADRRRTAVRRDLDTALAAHPEHPDLLFLAAMLEIEDADAIRVVRGSSDETSRRKQQLLEAAFDRIRDAEAASGSTFPRQRAIIGTTLGDVLSKRGERALSLEAYEASHESHRERGADAIRDLAILETRLASTHKALGYHDKALELHRTSLERREQLAEAADGTESARARRDLANGHLYLSEALGSGAPASARRHLERYLQLTFEVAWLDPLDRRGAVSDLEKAMARASRLTSLSDGDVRPFAIVIARFRDVIVAPRLETLPSNDSRRLAVRADRYLSEAAMHFASRAREAGETDEALRQDREATRRLDSAIEIGRVLVEVDGSQPEVVAEVGLCLAYRADLAAVRGAVDPSQVERWIAEATDLGSLARESATEGPIQRKLDRQLSRLSGSDASD